MDKTKTGSKVAPERQDTVWYMDIDEAGRSDNYGKKGAKANEGKCRIKKEQTDVEYHHQADQRVDFKDETEDKKSKRKKKKRRKSIDLLSAQDEQPQSHSQEIQGLDIEQSERTESHYVAKVAKNCILIPGSNVVMYSKKVIRKESDWAQLVAEEKMNLTNNKFEIEVINTGDTEFITMGLVPANYDQDTAVGWHDDSFGYHGCDGGIYIKSRLAESTLTSAKKGDIISLKLLPKDKEEKMDGPKTKWQLQDKTPDGEKEKSLEGEKWIYCIEIRNQKTSYQSKLTDLQIGLYPCLAILSTGAAVRLLDDTLLKGNGNTHIPVMSTKETEDLIISPAEAISMSENKRGMLYGLMSIYNKSDRPIAFEVYGRNNAGVVHKEILAHKKAWAECLVMQRDDVVGGITVEWTTHCSGAKDKDWTLEEICPNKEQREKHILEVVVEVLEVQDDYDDYSTHKEPSIRDELLKLLRSSDRDDQVEELIDRQSGSTELMRLRRNIQKDENAINVLLQILENAFNCNPRDENMMIDHVEKMLKKLKEQDILQTRNNDINGYTVLHYAALLGSTRLINLLLDKSIRIKYLAYVESRWGKLPLEQAIDNRHDETAKALVNMMSQTRVQNLFWHEGDHRRIKLTIKDLLKKGLTETTRAVLTHFGNFSGGYLVAPLELDDNKKCPEDKEYAVNTTTAYQMIAQYSLEELANHNCVKLLTEYKWRKYGYSLFLLSFSLYLFFWVALTTAAVTGVMAEDATAYNKPIDYVRLSCELAALCYAFLTFFEEGLQFYVYGCKYVADGYNYSDFSSSLLIICVLPLRLSNSDAQWGVFAVGYITCTFRSFKFLTVFRRVGLIGHMMMQLIIHEFWMFILFYLVILFGFSGGLLLSFKGDGDLDVHNETSTYWGILFVGVRVLIEGQPFLEYSGPNGYSTFSCMIMLLFLASTCVLMLNIFIAQLSHRYELIRRRYETHRVATIVRFERGDDLTSFTKFCCRFAPLWVKHFQATVPTLETLEYLQSRDRSIDERLRHWFPDVPSWIKRKICGRDLECSDDSSVSDCVSTDSEF